MTKNHENGFQKNSKHCGKKEKMLVTSIFSVSHSVFNSPLPFGGCLKSGLCGEEESIEVDVFHVNLNAEKKKAVPLPVTA